jgi:hypothetical protein
MTPTALIKAGRQTGGGLALRLAIRRPKCDLHGAAPAPTHPAEVEAIALRAQLTDAQSALAASQAEQAERLERQLRAAEMEMAAAHRDDDDQRITALVTALADSQAHFLRMLRENVEPVACATAVYALSRFASARSEDESWLLHVIADRLDVLTAGALIELQLAPSVFASDAAVATLAARIPSGCAIAVEPTLAHGTARLRLRLGAIDIDPELGMAAVVAALAALDGLPVQS